MILLNQVNKTYHPRGNAAVTAVKDVNLQVESGEFVVITGRSGSGKTTLLNLVAGLAQPSSGQVRFDGVDVWSLSDRAQAFLRNQRMGFVFQFPSLLQSLTTLENVLLPAMFAGRDGKKPLRERAVQLLEEVGLADKLSFYPRQLSAGQQQRVVVARSLVNQPELLLADEPTSNLDEQSEGEIINLIQDIHTRSGVTVLLVTHAGNLVTHGSRHVKMVSGSIASDNGTQE
jgi:ABC-type lipoprotein export system ATPase subunit